MDNSYFEMVQPSYMENWPALLFNASVSTVHFPLTEKEVKALLGVNVCSLEGGSGSTPKDLKTLNALADKVEFFGKQFPGGFYVRLGSRSPKDSWEGHREGFRCQDGKKAIQLLADSERVYDDLCLARANNYAPHLVVREWVDLAGWQEFRCFVKDGRLVGISQYFYDQVFPEVVEHHDGIQWAIEFFVKKIQPMLPTQTLIVDVFVRLRERAQEREWQVRLLETNPWSIYTDPCLFNWSRDTFEDFEFRYKKGEVSS